MPLTVSYEADKVIIDLGGRRRDVLLYCAAAEELEHALRAAADLAEKELPTPVRGERWGLHVESFDGMVAMRFDPPLGVTKVWVPMPFKVARRVADMVKFKREQAEHKMRLVVQRAKGT